MQVAQKTEWTVEHESKLLPFENFAAAIHYADELVKKHRGVKIIQLECRKITTSAQTYSRTGAVIPVDDGSAGIEFSESN